MWENSKIIEKYLWYLKNVYKNFDKDFALIKKASDIASIAHEWQFRQLTGTPFVAHPMRVAVMVAEKTDNLPTILAAILHDVVEDSADKFSMQYIYQEFGSEVGFLVDAVTDNVLYFYENPDKVFVNKTDKLLYGAIKDARCVFLKLMDRDHNNKTLGGLKTEKQIRKSFETQAVYSPLKKILRIDQKDFVLKDVCSLLSNYMKKNKLKTVDDLKISLYKNTFKDIDNYNFELFYYNSDNIVWKIEDKKMFERLIENNYFDSKTEIISLTQDDRWNFTCLFKYIEWKVSPDDIEVSVSGFKY